MEQTFWRSEVWHPLSVHFPIVLLLVSTFVMLISFFLKIDSKKHWRNTASVFLIVGCLTAWLSLYTGDLADGIVSRKICDPTILKAHELYAQTMTYLFTAASVLRILLLFVGFRYIVRTIFFYVILVLMMVGSTYLVLTAHLGAMLVYEQGAGVYGHSVTCD